MRANARLSLSVDAAAASAMYDTLFTPDGSENAGVLFCGGAAGNGWTRWLAREWRPVPLDAYRERLAYHLEITPAFYNAVVDYSIATNLAPVVVHSHPGSPAPLYSPSDDSGEARLLPVLAQLLPGCRPASILVARDAIAGRVRVGRRFEAIDEIRILGPTPRAFAGLASGRRAWRPRRARTALAQHDGEFDRQLRAIGDAGQRALSALRVAIVGLGGTGSAVVEQLARMGVGDFVLVDPDFMELLNIPRVWGSRRSDALRHTRKVDVATRQIRAIRPRATVQVIADSVIRQPVLMQLRDRDVVFGCTDNHWSRAVLNRFAHQYLIPLVDMGLRLDARTGRLTTAAGRVSLVGSGLTCLRCEGVVDAERVRAESMPATEREQRTREGYVQGVDDPEPSVISMNTTIASLAVTAGLSLFVNLTGAPAPLGLRYAASTGEVFVTALPSRKGCDVCATAGAVLGVGDLEPVSGYA